MTKVFIREPKIEDKSYFIDAMQRSQSLHHPWVAAPQTAEEFEAYLNRYQQPNQKSYVVCDLAENIVGVFNISEIVRGPFQNAFLGFYVASDYAAKGFMSSGLKLVLKKVFKDLELHRIEANIQPENTRSIQLVKKNGFRYEGYSPRYLKINDKWCGHEHWAITYEDYVRDEEEVLKKDHVEIVDYDPDWPNRAYLEIVKLQAAFPTKKIIDIQHVGSTAIPGMPAKPIIDIQIAVNSLDEMKVLAVPILQKLGYEYWSENPDPERMFFVKGMPPYGELRTHHVHIFEPSSKQWQGKLLFRDYLRANPKVAKEYQSLKLALAKKHAEDREEYTKAKLEFVNRILALSKKSG